jgi:transcriptional regulator with XRE-family HTH domain
MEKHLTFGQCLRELRKAKNLTQRELADRVAARLKEEDRRGFDFTYLSKIENDRMPPPSKAAIIQLVTELAPNDHKLLDELLSLAKKIPPDVEQSWTKSHGAREFYRAAINYRLTEQEWQELLHELERRKQR